jgi:hypothetical protein
MMLEILKFQIFGFQGHFFAFLVALATENDNDSSGSGVRSNSKPLLNRQCSGSSNSAPQPRAFMTA